MEKWQIIDEIEEIQEQVDEMGFVGSNEKELWIRDLIADYIVKKLIIPVVSNRRELLIATLHGWQDYKDQGISIEDYVDEIESNL